MSVFIVDDDEVSREVLATVFTIEGFEVRTARDGVEALMMLDSDGYRPRVVLTDVQMPGLSGADLISALRERVRLGSGAMLFAMSASEPRAGEVEGADGFLRKPFGAKELKQMIATSRSERETPFCEKVEAAAAQEPESAAGEASGPVIMDRKKLEALRAMMPETAVRQVYSTAMDDLSGRLSSLDAAIGRKDAKALRHIGHTIKGGCGMVGAVEAARLGAALETESDNLDNSQSIVAQLRSAIEALKDMLGREFVQL